MKRTVRWAACLLVLLAGCARQPRLSPLVESSVVVAFGDSLTSGQGVGRSKAYPAVLARRLGCRVVNAGVPGELSAEGLERLPGVLATHAPDLVILCHGGNDLLARRDDETIARALDAMVRLIRESGSEVLLLGVPRPGLTLRPALLYASVAAAQGIPYDGETVRSVLSSPALKSDLIHPNAAGYEAMADAIARRLGVVGALPPAD